jgi:hypothetical protein
MNGIRVETTPAGVRIVLGREHTEDLLLTLSAKTEPDSWADLEEARALDEAGIPAYDSDGYRIPNEHLIESRLAQLVGEAAFQGEPSITVSWRQAINLRDALYDALSIASHGGKLEGAA